MGGRPDGRSRYSRSSGVVPMHLVKQSNLLEFFHTGSHFNNFICYNIASNGWIMQMEEALTRRVNNLTLDHLQRVASLLLQGMDIADNIRNTVSTILNLHGKLSKVN